MSRMERVFAPHVEPAMERIAPSRFVALALSVRMWGCYCRDLSHIMPRYLTCSDDWTVVVLLLF